jgi:hypothetical protein
MAVCYMADDQCRRMRGEVFPIRGRRLPRPGARLPAPPRTWQPTVRWGRQEGDAGQRSWGRGQGRGFAARPLPTLCLAEYASITAGQTPGVMEQDLRRSEAWLGKCRQLAGVIRAVVAGPPPKAHRRSCGQGEHLARPWRGAGGRVVGDVNKYVMNVHHCMIIPKKLQIFTFFLGGKIRCAFDCNT